MRLSHRIEQFVAERGQASITELASWFGISPERCREEVTWVSPYGVELCSDDNVRLGTPHPLWDHVFN